MHKSRVYYRHKDVGLFDLDETNVAPVVTGDGGNLRRVGYSVTRFGEILSHWQNFKSPWQFLRVFGRLVNLL